MRKLALTVVLLVAFGGATGQAAQAENLGAKCPGVKAGINFYKKLVWKWENEFQISHVKASKKPIRSCRYGQWVASKWRDRAQGHAKWMATLERADRDFNRAASLASRVFPDISAVRLWRRADVEGGHGVWICNAQGSGACGWFQFMEGTLYGRIFQAVGVARKRGFPIPVKFISWHSLVGQNLTAAYMFSIGLECAGEGWAASC